MSKPQTDPNEVILASQSPLARAEAKSYVEQQKQADWNRNISQYMFWGATSIIGALAVGIATGGIGLPVILAGVAASVATFFGSVSFSRKATEMSERSNVLYSDIDSQNQAHRMVQAFAKAQTQGQSASNDNDVPFTASARRDGKSWADSIGSNKQQAGSWQAKVTADADRADAQALSSLGV